MPLIALTLIWLDPRPSVVAGAAGGVDGGDGPDRIRCVSRCWRWSLVDIAYYFLLRTDDHSAPLTVVLIHGGFQAFAAL